MSAQTSLPDSLVGIGRLRRMLIALWLSVVSAASAAAVVPLDPKDWPVTLADAVPLVLAQLNPAQRSIVRGTSKDNLFMLQGEWGEDIEELLGLEKGNTRLVQAVCGKPCKVEQATLLIMESAWESLAKAAPR